MLAGADALRTRAFAFALALALALALPPSPLASAPPWGEVTVVRSAQDVGAAVGWCDGQAFVFDVASAGLGDFTLKLVPALNGAARPAVSLLGLGFGASAPPRLGDGSGAVLVINPRWTPRNASGANETPVLFPPLAAVRDLDDATWIVVPGLADASNFSLISASRDARVAGKFLTRAASDGFTLCQGGAGSASGEVAGWADGSDAAAATFVLGPPPAPPPRAPATVAVDAGVVTHRIPKKLRGCHSDPGYEFQPRMFHAQLVYGDSFQCGPESACAWSNATVGAGDAVGSAHLDAAVSVNPADLAPSLAVTFVSGRGAIAWANRGIGNEGLSFEGGKVYEGRVVVLAPAGAAALYVAVNDYLAGAVLALQTLAVPASDAWQVLEFSLTPSAGCACLEYPYVSNSTLDCGPQGTNPVHICVRCSGEFAVGLAGAGAVHLGYVSLSPGPWGRFKAQPVLASGAALMQQLGWGSVRWGGHIARITAWKGWRGEPWLRASMQLDDAQRFISAGFGMFEFVDFARDPDVDIFPIVSLSADQTAGDFADLVEYCWGSASTAWGRVRIFNDSHPTVYNLTAVELGNEASNSNFLEQVTAMEARRVAVGAPPMFYIFPTDGGVDNATATALVAAGVPARAIAPDCHIDADGGCLDVLKRDFAALPDFDQSGINAEINALVSIAGRLSFEAADMQDWLNFGAQPGEDATRLIARTTSFCAARVGHVEPSWADQGVAHFLPNGTTVVQPVGYVHVMLTAATQPRALRVSVSPPAYAASAQLSDDGSSLVIQVANTASSGGSVTVQVANFVPSGGAALLTTLNATDFWAGNTVANPTQIAPWTSSAPWTADGTFSIALPANSFVIATATRAL